MARLQREDFDVGAEVAALVKKSRSTGATVTFLGTARDFSKGHEILKLDFHHYSGMAKKELAKLERTAKSKFDILDCLVIHRTGEIKINENIVLVIATSMHRAAAFDACQWMIDELKRSVPVWKKEFTSVGEEWVEEHP